METHSKNVIIAGSRTFDDYPLLERTLGEIFAAEGKPTLIICGEARGADSLGRRYAQEHGIPVASYPADWNRYGRSAGFRARPESAYTCNSNFKWDLEGDNERTNCA